MTTNISNVKNVCISAIENVVDKIVFVKFLFNNTIQYNTIQYNTIQ